MKFVVATLTFANAAAVGLEWGFGINLPTMNVAQKPRIGNLNGFGSIAVQKPELP